ncbi:MAG: poly(R)-hydroxyalkanoic acid synthase subunit PhaE [Anaerolineae bacterium]|jgi:polyhydroxyalkanoate synthesis regulator phasin
MGEKDEKPQVDPFAQMVQLYDDWTKMWSGAASEMVSSKSFADSMAQQLESTLSTAQLMRRQMSQIMEQSLQQMSLPTRQQVVGLAERMTSLEMRLDDMEAKLDEVLDLLRKRDA